MYLWYVSLGNVHGFSSPHAFAPKGGRERVPLDTGVSIWLAGGVRGVLGIPLAKVSRTLSRPIPTSQVLRVGRLVPLDLITRPAGTPGCQTRRADRLRSFPGTRD